ENEKAAGKLKPRVQVNLKNRCNLFIRFKLPRDSPAEWFRQVVKSEFSEFQGETLPLDGAHVVRSLRDRTQRCVAAKSDRKRPPWPPCKSTARRPQGQFAPSNAWYCRYCRVTE